MVYFLFTLGESDVGHPPPSFAFFRKVGLYSKDKFYPVVIEISIRAEYVQYIIFSLTFQTDFPSTISIGCASFGSYTPGK